MDEIKLDHSGGNGEDRVPWKYSDRLQNIFRDCNTRRMELQPFVYSLANTSYKNGVLMKPIVYVYPENPKTYEIWDEYMLGSAFLVAPILDSTDSRSVYLPDGTWLDYNNPAKSYKGDTEISVSLPIDKYPVFIKTNSIYVTGVLDPGNSAL